MNLFVLLFFFYYSKFQGIRREVFLENLKKLKETVILISKLANKRFFKIIFNMETIPGASPLSTKSKLKTKIKLNLLPSVELMRISWPP